jgi:hypothetical protein
MYVLNVITHKLVPSTYDPLATTLGPWIFGTWDRSARGPDAIESGFLPESVIYQSTKDLS